MIIAVEKFEKNIDLLFNDKIFNTNSVSFPVDMPYMDTYTAKHEPDTQSDLNTFGAVIKGNDYVIPAGLKFKIKKSYEDNVYFDIIRNYTGLGFGDLSDVEIDIELTKLGEKCFNFAQSSGKDFYEIAKNIIEYSDVFNIS